MLADRGSGPARLSAAFGRGESLLAARFTLFEGPASSEAAAVHQIRKRRPGKRGPKGAIPGSTILSTAAAVIDYLGEGLAEQPLEEARALYLDSDNRLLSDALIASGTVDRCTISFREILHRAFNLRATAFILVHNHPSGTPAPSGEDIQLTRALAHVSSLCDLRLLDHIIVSANGHRSLRAAGLL